MARFGQEVAVDVLARVAAAFFLCRASVERPLVAGPASCDFLARSSSAATVNPKLARSRLASVSIATRPSTILPSATLARSEKAPTARPRPPPPAPALRETSRVSLQRVRSDDRSLNMRLEQAFRRATAGSRRSSSGFQPGDATARFPPTSASLRDIRRYVHQQIALKWNGAVGGVLTRTRAP